MSWFHEDTDGALLLRIAEGDTAAFASLYRRYAAKLLHFVTGLLKDPQRAEDVVQDVFTRLYLSRQSLAEAGGSVEHWLFVCARNASVNILKSKWKTRVERVQDPGVLPHGEAETEAQVLLNEALARLDSAVSLLPDRRREIYRLSREAHLSSAEIAERTGLSVRTVEKHLELALKDIRSRFN